MKLKLPQLAGPACRQESNVGSDNKSIYVSQLGELAVETNSSLLFIDVEMS
jgi:hypothetical protein